MKSAAFQFLNKNVNCIFDAAIGPAVFNCREEDAIIVTDEKVYSLHKDKMNGFRVIRIREGEESKTQATVDDIIRQLLEMEAGKDNLLIGIGGGVVTDISGYVAAIYKRGMRLVLVPTTILAMVDAAIGGKNGVDVGPYKNITGTVYQPESIIFDYRFLDTLPVKEWINGFAEVIKHACIRDRQLFGLLEKNSLHDFQSDKLLMASIIEQNVAIKMAIVTADEFENGDRRLLNFGHTIGHAIENLHHLPHGHAVSLGMVAACNLSEKILNLHFEESHRVVNLLGRYHLPVDIETDYNRVFDVLKQDKKRESGIIRFVLLNGIGDAVTRPVAIHYLRENLQHLI